MVVLSLPSWLVLLRPDVDGETVMDDLWVERAGMGMHDGYPPRDILRQQPQEASKRGKGVRVYQCCLAAMHGMFNYIYPD